MVRTSIKFDYRTVSANGAHPNNGPAVIAGACSLIPNIFIHGEIMGFKNCRKIKECT